MFGKGVALWLAGWLWADLLLGLFAIFLAANTVAAPAHFASDDAVDPRPVELRLSVDGAALLGSDAAALEREQERVARAITAKLEDMAGGRRVAIVLAFGSHESPSEGDRLAAIATAALRGERFERAVVRAYHELVPGDRGSALALEIYLFFTGAK